MNKRELLQERYEDALFALLMDEIATSEGQKALEENERLKNDPEAQMPEELDLRCERAIRRGFAKRTARGVGRFTFKSAKKVVMAAGLAAMLFTTAFATSERVRVETMNFVIEVCEGYTEFNFWGNSTADIDLEIEVGWLPEGYILAEEANNDFSVWYVYRLSEETYIRIDYAKTAGMGLSVDTENAEVDEIDINGVKGIWIKTEGVQHLVLISEDRETVVDMLAEGMSEKDFLHVAGELKY